MGLDCVFPGTVVITIVFGVKRDILGDFGSYSVLGCFGSFTVKHGRLMSALSDLILLEICLSHSSCCLSINAITGSADVSLRRWFREKFVTR